MDANEIARKVLADWLCWDVGSILTPEEVEGLESRMVREIERAEAEERSLRN